MRPKQSNCSRRVFPQKVVLKTGLLVSSTVTLKGDGGTSGTPEAPAACASGYIQGRVAPFSHRAESREGLPILVAYREQGAPLG